MRSYFSQSLLGRDLLGSIVVFLVALPLCMGIAIASGMPPAAGLITGIIGGIVVGAIAGSPLQVSGPAAGLAVLVFELVREFGVAALGPVVLLAGVIQIVFCAPEAAVDVDYQRQQPTSFAFVRQAQIDKLVRIRSVGQAFVRQRRLARKDVVRHTELILLGP